MGVSGVGFGVEGLRVEGLGFGVLGCSRFRGLGFRQTAGAWDIEAVEQELEA